ncbi:MAG: hypothetical protein ACXADY_21025 [Candidatus Hodarchaeales archaeon]|jgi:hypothetical protein
MKETTIVGVSFIGFVSPHRTISIKKLEKLTRICSDKWKPIGRPITSLEFRSDQ